MRRKSALVAGILAGFASPGSVYAEPTYPRIDRSDTARLRGDVTRVGRYFDTVMKREDDKRQADKPR